MSVILDALRRRRKESMGESSMRGIPAGLGLTSAVSEVSRQRDQRFKRVAVAMLVVLAIVWFGVRFNSREAVIEPAQVHLETRAPGPGPRVPGPEPRVPSPEPRVPSPEPRVPSPEPRAPSSAPRRPNRDIDHFGLALRYQDRGEFEQAREQYLAVLAGNSFNAEARNNLGLLYHGRGMTDDAIDQFNQAIQINPRYTKARSNLAVVLTSAGRLAEARTELRAALDVEPHNPDLMVNMALVEKADQHAEQAIEILLRAIAASPMHAAAHYNLAVLYEERGSIALAIDHYNAFLKLGGPERRALLADVQRRIRAIEPRLQGATN